MLGISSNSFDIMIFVCIAIVGIVLSIFIKPKYTENSGNGPATSLIWGYGLMIFSLFGMIITSFSLTTQLSNITSYNTFDFIKKLFLNSLLPLLMLFTCIWVFILYSTYYSKLNEGKIPNEVNTISILISIIFTIQFINVFHHLYNKLKTGNIHSKTKEMLKSVNSIIMYVTSLINIVFIGIMTIILKFFSTDG